MAQITARKIELWPLSRLNPYANNSRTHSADQVQQIAASIATYGFNNPILVDTEDGIIAGHGRLSAAQSLQLEHVPVIVLDHLTDAQRRAYILADNRLAELAQWDDDLLVGELEALGDDGIDISSLGWSPDELDQLQEDLEEMLEMDDPKTWAMRTARRRPPSISSSRSTTTRSCRDACSSCASGGSSRAMRRCSPTSCEARADGAP